MIETSPLPLPPLSKIFDIVHRIFQWGLLRDLTVPENNLLPSASSLQSTSRHTRGVSYRRTVRRHSLVRFRYCNVQKKGQKVRGISYGFSSHPEIWNWVLTFPLSMWNRILTSPQCNRPSIINFPFPGKSDLGFLKRGYEDGYGFCRLEMDRSLTGPVSIVGYDLQPLSLTLLNSSLCLIFHPLPSPLTSFTGFLERDGRYRTRCTMWCITTWFWSVGTRRRHLCRFISSP